MIVRFLNDLNQIYWIYYIMFYYTDVCKDTEVAFIRNGQIKALYSW